MSQISNSDSEHSVKLLLLLVNQAAYWLVAFLSWQVTLWLSALEGHFHSKLTGWKHGSPMAYMYIWVHTHLFTLLHCFEHVFSASTFIMKAFTSCVFVQARSSQLISACVAWMTSTPWTYQPRCAASAVSAPSASRCLTSTSSVTWALLSMPCAAVWSRRSNPWCWMTVKVRVIETSLSSWCVSCAVADQQTCHMG